MTNQNYGWIGSVRSFLEEDPEEIVTILSSRRVPSHQQILAWENTVEKLHEVFTTLIKQMSIARSWWLVFEYELPREGGRRPDVIILTKDIAFVIEVKNRTTFQKANIDQVKAYRRDLKEYHLESRALNLVSILLILQATNLNITKEEVHILSPSELAPWFKQLPTRASDESHARSWINSAYEPLPSLVQAAKYIFHNEPLPQIKQAASAGIPQALASLKRIVEETRTQRDRRLVLLSGAPGAGKTLVGLQFVHEISTKNEPAVFLSGNAPLIAVLQDALKSKVFVQDVHRFIRTHGVNELPLKNEHILVFDEGQRAWDRERIQSWYEKKGIIATKSEPEMFVKVASQIENWAVILVLVGYGQEIYLGEESGLIQWQEAIQHSGVNWTIHCPERIAKELDRNHQDLVTEPSLDLNISLRSHTAETVHKFVNELLNANIGQAAKEAEKLKQDGFTMLITKNLDAAKEYITSRYEDEPSKIYGIIASSRSHRSSNKYGIDTSFYSRQTLRRSEIPKWYNGDTKNATFGPKCRDLEKLVTEFDCQGLELDGTLIAWGVDMVWDKDHWKTPRVTARNKAKDPKQLRINSYRVLLTRSRDGFIVYCPDGREMKNTFEVLVKAGLEEFIGINGE